MLAGMEVIFYFSCTSEVSQENRLAEIMVQTCRAWMPDSIITQLTDLYTEAVPGVDNVERFPVRNTLAEGQAHAFAEYAKVGLYVDTDVVFLDDVSPVWDADFDFAARRTFKDLKITDSPEVFDADEMAALKMPYNMGIVFCRTPRLWKKIIEAPIDWYEGQIAFGQLASDHLFLDLDEAYHFVPNYLLHDLGGQKIIHFKGPKRKRWMMLLFGHCQVSLGALKRVNKHDNSEPRPTIDGS
jgi:hypothetical protein